MCFLLNFGFFSKMVSRVGKFEKGDVVWTAEKARDRYADACSSTVRMLYHSSGAEAEAAAGGRRCMGTFFSKLWFSFLDLKCWFIM